MPDGAWHFHLDEVDALKQPLTHLLAETRIVEGAVVFGGLALLAAALTGGNTGQWAAAGIATGAIVGATEAKRARRVLTLREAERLVQRA